MESSYEHYMLNLLKKSPLIIIFLSCAYYMVPVDLIFGLRFK